MKTLEIVSSLKPRLSAICARLARSVASVCVSVAFALHSGDALAQVHQNAALDAVVTSYSSQINNTVWAASNINDGDITNGAKGWASIGSATAVRDEWVILDLGQPKTLRALTVQNEPILANRNVKAFLLYGSLTGEFDGEETLLAAGSIPGLAPLEEHRVVFPAAAVRYVKFQGVSSHSTYILVGELKLHTFDPVPTHATAFPLDLQLFPRDTTTNLATVEVGGNVGGDTARVDLTVYRDGQVFQSRSHLASHSGAFQFEIELPAELAQFDFTLTATSTTGVSSVVASAVGVVAGDVYVINGQSNAAAGIFSAEGPGAADASPFVRSFGVNSLADWVHDANWHIVPAECRPSAQPPGCIGRWGLRFASNLVAAEGIPIAVVNGARGGQSIAYFARDNADPRNLDTNYGRLLTRLEMAGVANALRGVFWYQGESDRGSEQAHINGFETLFDNWEADFPSVERYYIFQIRHTCVPSDTVNGQGSVISNFQREFANSREHVRAVSTTGLDGHDGCHFQYTDGYQTLGDNVSRMVQHDHYGRDFDNADAPDIVRAEITGERTVSLWFTGNNTLIGESGFESLFRLQHAQTGDPIAITGGDVSSENLVTLTTDQPVLDGSTLTVSYLSLPGAQNWLVNAVGIGIQSFLDVPVAFESDPATDTLLQLQRHLRGEDTLSAQELAQWRATFVSQLPSVPRDSRVSILEEAVATITEYEQDHGPLFTADGVRSFPTVGSVGDGHDLSRTMNIVYLALFDAIDADLIADHPEFVEGLAFGLSHYFPGDVERPVNPSTTYSVDIHASVPEDWGRPNLYSRLPARRPTGTYLAPGDIAEVTVPQSLVGKGYQIRVGGHSWDLSNKPQQKRLARTTKLYPVTSAVTRVANPLGGGIYVEVPYLADDGLVTVGVSNVVRSPYLSLRTVTPTVATRFQWDMTERLQPGPWTDIESDKVLFSVPSRWIREYGYAELVELVEAYEDVLDSASDYMGKPHVRNKSIVYMQVDVTMRGVAFFPGYPMGNYPSFDSLTPQAPLSLDHPLNATFLHEHGHATYMTKFRNETEASVHMLYVAAATDVYGMDLYEAFSRSLHYTDQSDITLSDAFASWALRPSFVNNVNMDHAEAGYRYAGHADYVEIIDLFGMEVMQRFNRTLNVDYVETGYDFDRNAHDPGDRILRLSRAAGADLTPLIHMWGVVPPSSLASQIGAEGLLPSARIYDRMVSYRDAIPLTQASYDAFHAKMSSTLWYRDYWDALLDAFDPAIGEAALARLNGLIDQYFPNGRPEDPAVRVYSEDGNTGVWLTLPVGEYDRAALDALGVGEAIASLRITAGLSLGVTACSGLGDSRLCANYIDDAGELGTVGGELTHVLVGPAPVTIYQHTQFGGAQWPLTAGVFDESAVGASPVGLGQASSIRVMPGYAVLACESADRPASCVTFAESAADLLSLGLNDTFDWFDVSVTADNRFFPNTASADPLADSGTDDTGRSPVGGFGLVTLLWLLLLGLHRRPGRLARWRAA